jgi:outer membrane protein OmpA-like peptidoglycan-associated protein
MNKRVVLALLPVAASLVACGTSGPVLRGRVQALEERVETAQKNGAVKCAPRELAIAASHLRFASTALDQGRMSAAQAHLALAEPNAIAAFEMSPADRCNPRGFVEVAAMPKPAAKPPPRPGDRDGDGIPDDVDTCPNDPENYNGFQDTDGCPDDPDSDMDGVADSRDQCILDPEDKDGYLDEDGCPELDNDSDGVPDFGEGKTKDGTSCANMPEDMDGFQDDDGCPDPDNDGDSVADLGDDCPNIFGIAGGTHPGCPKANTLIVVTAKEIKITQQIQFVTASWIILPPPSPSYSILDSVDDVLNQNPKITLEVQGHTDNVGPYAYNMNLSQQRANSVMTYMIKHGIAASRLTAKGYGYTQPLVPNDSDAHRQMNRRVQFIRTESGAPTTTTTP